jgi:glycosyltransferase involved in cell wall biosynthesis
MINNKRIAYVALIMSFQSGVANKMKRLAQSAFEEDIPIDYYWFTTNYQIENKNLAPLTVESTEAGNPLKVRKWQAKKINELLKKYHRIVIRYPLYDPVLHLFLKHKKRLITEHHTKELEELKLTGDKRYWMEKTLGNRWIKNFGGLIAVSNEIIDYEISRSGFNGSTAFIPNSIPHLYTVDDSVDNSNQLNLIMVANFRPWHGLETIIKGLKKYNNLSDQFKIHLVGEIPEHQKTILQNFKNVVLHGHLNYDQIENLYKHMHIGIGGYNLISNNMKEATALKVREYFANGLKVIMGYCDPAFPKDFPLILQSENFDIPEIIKFDALTKKHTKAQIVKQSEPFISSKFVLKKLYDFCINL